MYRVVNTDNFGSDYPMEWFVGEACSRKEAEVLAKELNNKEGPYSDRYHKVELSDYKLIAGFLP